MKALFSLASVAVVMLASTAHATDERPSHFKGEDSPTWEVAQENLSEYNQRLAKLVNQDQLSADDLHQVHQLTYTLENALERMEEELEKVAETLEKVHVASETNKPDTVKKEGEKYLTDVEKLLSK
ncbi:DUF6746 family protein [Oceanisphaera avium]|uniref:Uncharacterized protein n=1 Tax=Oceanisphaera avium TaxID=1903694 RepID=A0A1Y0CZ66_9GAMM|nr:DUF6746 family protein [Oceanisphaera avium]ART80621.1 hypothetical protein CBP12_11095 [Oceanisphaera avium]